MCRQSRMCFELPSSLANFVTPFFRKRTFPGKEGRSRFPLVVDVNRSVYQSGVEESHPDLAARWSHTLSNFDIGISCFFGTSRNSRLISADDGAALIPYYDFSYRTGVDIQYKRWLVVEVRDNSSNWARRPLRCTYGWLRIFVWQYFQFWGRL